ncbi:aminopeptidase N [Mycobacterium intracellulare]|uniref:Aminopeptidase N n=1 Tax=Mycobacterium intracellulare subsp. chimaera TaxID=222805 RepID=A0A220Y9H2_MYCIT|nr:aminopeptidase N [Mycobacterium intracellulare]ARV81565.1 aminopeptidase N [Mycobacterium intracellulare subsp. chimaera]ASL08663.1 aminopeptidase N [Mycobacterium intracellulare subsp. chimaera]ASL14291.1 aminopeptidase N [Mycobacterium intracellulare subsp. chimaera]ASL20421.1 aminopeptidase N [Mycobacterium intracellulare subsp. chimaera]ASQ85583.1 aminopeptidase N [Mycobacterium intracellulare subsp. chimaera]
MALPNLTREQAVERASLITVASYQIDLDLTDSHGGPGERTFRSVTTVVFDALAGADTVIDIAADTVRGATLNGRDLDVSGYDESTGIELRGLADRNVVVVDADCRYSNTGEGLHRFVDPVDNETYLYSQFETADAKRMFACFDQPDLKATFDVRVTAPRHWKVISNGATVSVTDGLHTFATTPRMSTYLVALIAGPYAEWKDAYTDEHGEIPLGIYCRASLAPYMDAERLFTQTKQGFGFYHKNFGLPYAFGKYDQLFVPEFNAGAMENAGAVTFLEDYVFRSKVTRASYERRAETVLHEMAHMWFGDLVTMAWWDDLWLNESFATFASVLCQSEATEFTEAWTTFATVEKSWAYRQDQLPSTHPIAADIPDLAAVEVNFDGITYAKGASVLKQLVAYVGLEHFLAGLRDYFRTHAFGNATFDDLVAALEKASGRDLSDWGQQWLKTTGLNTLRPDFDVDGDGRFTRFAVTQSGAAPGAGETRVHRLAIGVYDDDGSGKLVRVRREELDVEGPVTEVPALVGVSRGQLVLVNDDDLTYCSLRLDAESLRTALGRIADIAEPLPRSLVWSAAWEMTREAELRARDFVALVAGGVHAETEVGVAQRLLLQAQTALTSYAEPGWAREEGWPQFADRLLELARAAQPGSDHQLAFVNTLCSSVLSTRHVVTLADLLDRSPEDLGLPGLEIDTDLRWRIVTALATAGDIDADGPATPFIDAEVQRDPTAAGKRHGAQAATARPQLQVKEEAWTRVVEDDTLANITARAIIAGIAPPAQHELLKPFTARYFEAISGVWARRSSEVAQTVVVGLYPHWDISEDGIAAADEFLSDPEVPAALRRLVLEGQAGVKRSLRARRFDAE